MEGERRRKGEGRRGVVTCLSALSCECQWRSDSTSGSDIQDMFTSARAHHSHAWIHGHLHCRVALGNELNDPQRVILETVLQREGEWKREGWV